MTQYPDSLLIHLGTYCKEHLGITEPGSFRYKGVDLPMAHILPKVDENRNLLPGLAERAGDLKDCHGKPIKWHRYFHHLNSSQAMAINLFQPLFDSAEGLQILGQAIGMGSVVPEGTGFEFVPDSEEKTNIDVCLAGKDGKRLFIEVKLTENDFGKAKDDTSHQDKFEKLYAPRCGARFIFESEDKWGEFRSSYQFYRNALYADENTEIRFLIPAIHRSLVSKTNQCLTRLNPGLAERVKLTFLGDFVSKIEKLTTGGPLESHFAHFRQKYGPALVVGEHA